MHRDALVDIAGSGLLAPSADNAMSFQFEYGADEIVIWADEAFPGRSRYRRMLELIAYGAMVENMALRAKVLGFELYVRWWPAESTCQMARVRFVASDEGGRTDLAQAIPERHTNRRLYRGPALTSAERGELSAEAGPASNTTVVWLEGAARRRALRLIWRAEAERFRAESLHAELFSAVRFDLGWQDSSDRALPLGALEIDPPMRPIFKALRHWPVMRVANLCGTARMLALRAAVLPCWQAPALGLIVSETPSASLTDLDIVAAGRAFERLWLRSTTLGLALQPFAASTTMPFHADNDQAADATTRASLAAGWRKIVGEATPLMVFRIGRAEPPSVRTGRPSIESLTRPPRAASDVRAVECPGAVVKVPMACPTVRGAPPSMVPPPTITRATASTR